MSRAFCTFVAAGWLLSISTVEAAHMTPFTTTEQRPAQKDAPPLPYKEVLPYKEDARTVRVFFTFDCPYSFLYDGALWRWGLDLPKNWHIEFTPVLTKDPSSMAALKAFYAVQAAAPTHLQAFMEKAFQAIQQDKRNAMEQQTWVDIVAAAGIDLNLFKKGWNSLPPPESLVTPVVDRATHYAITVTPTVSIDGRYVISPENTNGNGDLFMQLLNGMVSKAEGYA